MNANEINRQHDQRRQLFIDGQYHERYGSRIELPVEAWIGPRPARLADTPKLTGEAWERWLNMEQVSANEE